MTTEGKLFKEEPILVQLARLDGKLDRLGDQIGSVGVGVGRHQIDIEQLKSLTQTLQEGAVAAKDTALALALALKDAKESQEATARAETVKQAATSEASDRSWVPYARMITVLVTLIGVVTLYLQVKP